MAFLDVHPVSPILTFLHTFFYLFPPHLLAGKGDAAQKMGQGTEDVTIVSIQYPMGSQAPRVVLPGALCRSIHRCAQSQARPLGPFAEGSGHAHVGSGRNRDAWPVYSLVVVHRGRKCHRERIIQPLLQCGQNCREVSSRTLCSCFKVWASHTPPWHAQEIQFWSLYFKCIGPCSMRFRQILV